MTPAQIAWEKLGRHPLAMLALVVLFLLYGGALFADVLAPYGMDSEVRAHSYHPPTRLHWVDAEGGVKPLPFIYAHESRLNELYQRVWREDRTRAFPLRFWVRGDSYKFLGLIPFDRHLVGVDKPARLYILGADSRGRDLLSRILFGARISLSVGLLGILISFSLGSVVGGISGYFGGWVDNLLMRLAEMIMMIPGFYLMLTLRAAFPANLSGFHAYLLIVVILSFIGWASLARIIRGMALAIRTRDYCLAARALGVSHLAIVIRHIIPNTFSYLIVAATLAVPGYILGEATLSFLGLGIQDPQASWGNLLSEAMAIAQIRFHPWILWPGVFIFVSVMAFNLVGDGLRDALDPRSE